jgi:hypothetical protein
MKRMKRIADSVGGIDLALQAPQAAQHPQRQPSISFSQS